jgi:radical SAM protein with 4Fe4S-binding SPASM domain
MATHALHGPHGPALARLRREDAFFAAHGHARTPQLVQWLATLRCPLSCPHCLAAGEGGPELTFDEVRRLVDEVAALGVPELLVTGGEPLAREDLAEVVGYLGVRGVPWSLNTAAAPDERQRRAMERCPPGFVAVSLDGPRAVHDAFRGRPGAFDEALAAIRFFTGLPGCRVAAGTTVTAANWPALGATFPIVAASGAHSWGIHLPIPEGRAAERPDLLLSRRQLRRLLRFVARRRRWFPVSLADEIGWCGDWEPLLRDGPFRCGAGTLQCVVLPDGDVVPCTTLDRSTRAGSLRERPLADLWRDGFAALRAWTPDARCAACADAAVCGGGCWLQRRAGAHCFRDVWRVPAALRTAAGVALCLGVLGGAPGGAASVAAALPPAVPPASEVEATTGRLVGGPAGDPGAGAGGLLVRESVEERIVGWYTTQVAGLARPTGSAPDPDQPGAAFAADVFAGALPTPLGERAAAARSALESPEPSLALASLAWRALAEAALDGPPVAERPEADRAALREALFAIDRTAAGWRRAVAAEALDPYLARGRRHLRQHFELSKALRPMPLAVRLRRDTDEERWGPPAGPSVDPAAVARGEAAARPAGVDAWLARHPWDEHLRLGLAAPKGAGVQVLGAAGAAPVRGDTAVGAFHVVRTPPAPAGAPESGAVPVTLRFGERRLAVRLPPGAELSYADLLRLADEQHRAALDAAAAAVADAAAAASAAVVGPPVPDPLLLPALRRRAGAPAPAGPAAARALAPWFADFWLF